MEAAIWGSAHTSRSAEREAWQAILQRAALGAIFLGCFLAANYLYIEHIQPIYGYMGLALAPSDAKAFSAASVCASMALFIPKQDAPVRRILSVAVILISLFPTAVMYASGGLLLAVFAMTIALVVALYFTSLVKLPLIGANRAELGSVLVVLILLSGVGCGIVLFNMGFGSFSLGFWDVYERRAIAYDHLQGASAYISAIGMQAGVFGLFLAISQKRYSYAVAFFCANIIYFGMIGHKSQVVIIVILLVTYRFLVRRDAPLLLSAGVLAFFLGSIYIFSSGFDTITVAFILQRVFFIPVLVTESYIKYFDSYGPLYWSYSLVSAGVIEYTDTVNPEIAIGYYMLGSTETHANTGIIGSGYMNAYALGYVIYLTVFCFMTAIIDSLASSPEKKRLAFLLCLPSLQSLTQSSDLPGMLLSGGLGFAVLLLYAVKTPQGSGEIRN